MILKLSNISVILIVILFEDMRKKCTIMLYIRSRFFLSLKGKEKEADKEKIILKLSNI